MPNVLRSGRREDYGDAEGYNLALADIARVETLPDEASLEMDRAAAAER